MCRPMFSVCLALLVGLILCVSSPAQESASIQAVAVVLPSVTIVGTNDLDFEDVLPEVRKSVNKSAIGYAGEWFITGNPQAEITLDFTLPDSLHIVNGLETMKIGFTTADASYDDGTGAGQTAPSGVLNPQGINTRPLGGDGTMVVWLGGTVYPTRSQNSGIYSGEVMLTVTYTGN